MADTRVAADEALAGGGEALGSAGASHHATGTPAACKHTPFRDCVTWCYMVLRYCMVLPMNRLSRLFFFCASVATLKHTAFRGDGFRHQTPLQKEKLGCKRCKLILPLWDLRGNTCKNIMTIISSTPRSSPVC